MSLRTFSIFYFNFSITNDTKYLSFSEVGTEIIAELEVGEWTATELEQKIKIAMDTAGSNIYNVTFNRQLQSFTITGSSNFSLLVAGGTSGASCFPTIGFAGSDRTGFQTYTGNRAGEAYQPQFILQDFVPSSNYQRLVSPAVNKSANGRVEVVRFGTEKFIQMNMKFITDLPQDGTLIKSNPNGVEDLVRFLQFATQKIPFEFMANENDRNTYQTVILESTVGNSDGTGYQLKELYDKGLPEVFETGILTFRVLEI